MNKNEENSKKAYEEILPVVDKLIMKEDVSAEAVMAALVMIVGTLVVCYKTDSQQKAKEIFCKQLDRFINENKNLKHH